VHVLTAGGEKGFSLLVVDRNTPCTSILLMVERDAPYQYYIEKSYVNAGMPDKSYSGICISFD
jgi:hypothetical protein